MAPPKKRTLAQSNVYSPLLEHDENDSPSPAPSELKSDEFLESLFKPF